MTADVRRWIRWVTARRVDGVEAVRWRNGFYTRNRTDLPYPTGERREA